jgi:alpha-ketoglutarate-dependent taurine dioxygenase
MPSLEARPLSPALGAEVCGLDLARPLADAAARDLARLFDRHHLLLLRGQAIGADEHVRLCRALLPVSDPPSFLSNVEPGAYHPEVELLFHSDFTFTPYPLDGISLHALELAPAAAPTRFANAVRAACTLPPALRERLERLRVVMLANVVAGGEHIPARRVRVAEDASRELYPRRAHPALARHPRTGERYLHPSEQQASHFEGIPLAESDALFDALFAHLYTDENVYEHAWQEGDLVVWDNLALQHGRRENPRAVRRSFRRVVMSPKPFLEIVAGTVYARAGGA